MHKLFCNFSLGCCDELYPLHVRLPSTLEKLIVVESAYAAIGIPGACGSMDIVHISLGACPREIIDVCTGKLSLVLKAILGSYCLLAYIAVVISAISETSPSSFTYFKSLYRSFYNLKRLAKSPSVVCANTSISCDVTSFILDSTIFFFEQ